MILSYLIRSLSVVLFLILVIKIFYEYVRIRIKLFTHGKKIKGPLAFPIIGNAFDFMVPSNQMMYKWCSLKEKFGSPLRLWAGSQLIIIITDPEQTQTVLMSTKVKDKGATYEFLKPFLGYGLFTGSGDLWKVQRHAISPIFTPKMMANYLPSFSNHCESLNCKLQGIPNGKLVDIFDEIGPCTYDIVCETLLGTTIRFSQNPWKLKFFQLAELGYEIVFERMIKNLYQSDILFYFSKRYNDYKKIQKLVEDFNHEVLKDKQDSSKAMNFQTSLDKLLQLHSLTEQEKMDATYVLFTASHESTTTIASFVFLMLAIHPDIQEKVHEEIDRVMGTDDEYVEFTLDMLNSLEYLEMCIKEALRLFPIGHIIERECKQDFKLNDDTVLPRGCSIGIGIFAMHRDPNIWTDPNQFIPERFSREESMKRHPYAYIPFSAGPMNCIGKIYADLLMKSVTAAVLRNYRFETDYKSIDEVELKTDISIRPTKGYPVRIYSR